MLVWARRYVLDNDRPWPFPYPIDELRTGSLAIRFALAISTGDRTPSMMVGMSAGS
jgi:hypothetical protein